MKKTFLLLLILFFTGKVISQEMPEKIKNHWRKDFLFRLSPSINYFSYGDLNLFEIPYDQAYGISSGIIWNKPISYNFIIRLEGYYEYQNLLSYGIFGPNLIRTTFINQFLGLDIFPLVIKKRGKFEPEFALGGFAKNLLNSDFSTSINNFPLKDTNYEFQSLQSGIVIGTGFYWKKKLVELRAYRATSSFVRTNNLTNNLTQLKLVIGI